MSLPSEKHILDIIDVRHPRPLELCGYLGMFSASEIQERLRLMLDAGKIVLSSTQKLERGGQQ